jgi:murein DD-endopeptidase MepM/ murein hydrolase activator NlpD
LHAGCDLYAPPGTPIRAMNDGIVMRPVEYFYAGTNVLAIKHEKFIARYGEIANTAPGIKNGAHVKKGQIIAYVGQLKLTPPMSMLHIELYRGDISGPLTVKGNKYQRRGDLIDPTVILDVSKK